MECDACCSSVLWLISERGGVVYGGVGRFVVGVFGKVYMCVGEWLGVCVVDGVYVVHVAVVCCGELVWLVCGCEGHF